MTQKKRHSLLEALISTAIGFVISFAVNFIMLRAFGFNISLAVNLWLTIIFTVLSIVRQYCVRRLFVCLHARGVL